MRRQTRTSRRLAPSNRQVLDLLESRMLMTAAISSAIGIGNTTDSSTDRIASIVVDTDGTMYVAGSFVGSMDIDPSGTVNTLYTSGAGFTTDPLTGLSTLTPGTDRDIFIAAYKNNVLQWVKTLGSAGDDEVGSMLLYQNTLVVTGTFSGVLYTGYSDYLKAFNDPNAVFVPTPTVAATANGGTDAFITRFSKTGRYLNATQAIGGVGDDTGNLLAPSADGTGVYVQGTFQGDAVFGGSTLTAVGDTDIYVAKVLNDGTITWGNQYSDTSTLTVADITTDATTGNLYLTGLVNGTVDFDAGAGTANITTANGAVVAQLAPTGALNWVKTFGPATGTGAALTIKDTAVDSAGNLLVVGNFTGTLDVDPSPETHVLTAASQSGFVVKLDSTGNYVWSGALTGTGASSINAVLPDVTNNFYITGSFTKDADFDLGAGTMTFTAPTTFDSAFVAKYDAAGNFVFERGVKTATGASSGSVLAVTPSNGVLMAGNFTGSVTFSAVQGGFLPNADVVLKNTTSGGNFIAMLGVSREPTVVGLTKDLTNPIAGQYVTWTALVQTSSGKPTGSVRFYVDNTFLAEVPLASDETATYKWLSTPGNHTMVAQYSGDANYGGASSAGAGIIATPNRLPVGNIDSTLGGVVRGWDADLDAPAAALVTQVLIDGQLRASFVAKESRGDLANVIGTTEHGFSYELPFLPAGTHLVQVIAYDALSSEGIVIGARAVVSNSPYFNEAWYLKTYPDVAAAVASGGLASGWQHFISTGSHEGRSPSALFDEAWYRSQNPDVAAAIAAGTIRSGFVQYASVGAAQGRNPSPYFNESYYRRAYPDVNAAIAGGKVSSGFAHFLTAGLREGRSGTPWFSSTYYAQQNPDVVAAVVSGQVGSLFEHFVTAGVLEHRLPSTLFNESAYLSRYADVQSAVTAHTVASGLQHFVLQGFNEGRISVASFNEAAYVAAHPEVNAAIASGAVKSPFQYYMLYGTLAGHALV